MGPKSIRAILGLTKESKSAPGTGNETNMGSEDELGLSTTYSRHSRSFTEPTRTQGKDQHHVFVELSVILERDGEVAPYSTDVYLSDDPTTLYYIREKLLVPRDRKRLRVAKIEMGIGSKELVARLMKGVAKDDFKEPVVSKQGVLEEGVLKVELVQVRVLWEMTENMTGFWTEIIGESDEEIAKALEMMDERGWSDHFELVFGVADEEGK
ncbi:hypothetical protein VTL71DRAFT_14885 [Oculimacula yallundae]|uniref:Uncharacterized protein n=1 Tax=Oculimacula yallundae TaxID=86028 RepID=A0ABR4CF52_9HELO